MRVLSPEGVKQLQVAWRLDVWGPLSPEGASEVPGQLHHLRDHESWDSLPPRHENDEMTGKGGV